MATALVCPECGHEVRPPPDERLMLGRLVLRTDICTAYFDGEAIRLAPKEAAVLAALMRYPELTVPVEYLMNASDFWGQPHVMTWYMMVLRKKVGRAVEIQNHKRVGYSIHPRGEDGGSA